MASLSLLGASAGAGFFTPKRVYDHRKTWIRQRLIQLAAIMAVESSFYTSMDNHLHLLLRNRPDLVKLWSEEEVIRRACRPFPHKFREMGVENQRPTVRQLRSLVKNQRLVAAMRKRLSSISSFMKCVCEPIAKRCNAEDGVTGHFWEGRFTSKRILDEVGVMICGVYVDLNKVRAGISQMPEDSEFTSAFDRIQGRAARRTEAGPAVASSLDGWLTPICVEGDGQQYPGGQRASDKGVLSISLDEYLQLLDWTGRVLRPDKPGAIAGSLPPILERLGLQEKAWLACIRDFSRRQSSRPRLSGLITSVKAREGRPPRPIDVERRGRTRLHSTPPRRRFAAAKSGAAQPTRETTRRPLPPR